MTAKSLDLVLPCYNPLSGWERRIVQSYDIIQRATGNLSISVYVVNDGSQKGITEEEVNFIKDRIPGFHFISYEKNRGKGYALRQGINRSAADCCIYTDIDFPFNEKSLISVYESLQKEEADVVVGIRNDGYYKNVPKMRILISKVLRFFIRHLLGMKINDTQCGLKGFNSKGKALFVTTTIDRYLFDLEFIHKASNTKGITLKPVPVELKEGIVFSKMNTKILVTEGLSFFKILLRHYLPFS